MTADKQPLSGPARNEPRGLPMAELVIIVAVLGAAPCGRAGQPCPESERQRELLGRRQLRYDRIMQRLLLAGLVVAVGCKKEPAASLEPPATPTAPASTEEQDALWKLAPVGAMFGFVASPRGIALVERSMIALQALGAEAPEFAPLLRPVEDKLRRVIGTPRFLLADVGLTRDKGFAAFIAGDSSLVMVLPVGNRDTFLAKLHGTKTADGDELGGSLCRTIENRYVCVQHRELFTKLGGAGLEAARAAAGARGDLEFASGGAPGSENTHIALAAQLAPGAVIVRGAIGGMPRSVLDKIGSPVRPSIEVMATSGFGGLDPVPLLAAPPPLQIVNGVTVDQLARSITGRASFATPSGAPGTWIHVPLNDPAPAKTVIAHCADVPSLARAGATVQGDACHLALLGAGSEFDAWVEDRELWIGSRKRIVPTPITPSPLAAELANNAWSIVFFGRGSFLHPAGLQQAAAMAREGQFAVVSIRVLPLLNEFGLAIRKDGEALNFVVGIRTAWANSDDVVQKLLAISSEQLLSGKAAEVGSAIAAGAPNSLFAQDLKAGAGGLRSCLALSAFVAGFASPEIVKTMNAMK